MPSAHAATVYVTTTCTSTSTTTITHISASSTQIFTSAIPVVETPVAPSASTILVPLSSSGPSSSAGSSLLYTSEAAPFPTAVGTGASAPVGTGAASGTGAPISPAVPYKGAAARCHTGGLFGGGVVVVAIGAAALALC
ncbi:MAG: hypothetical protein ALECFALPRED_001880 [Alectoria fallacina]|uniref:Uncharacterized protein n=1 Tax=Alectoria fallacina TaxID=1903189 RepID=A0A8H3IK44_9LECA|nr:MAG: hypothetical protein ALECFALPRED_001880 [Alectoria fallacina]